MANADDQLKRMEIRSSGSSRRIMASKNWAIGSGWSTEVSIKGGFIRPELKVVDPIEEGENWTPDESAALLTLAMRMQLQQSLDGLGMSNVAKKLVPDGGAPESDRPPGYPGRTGRWRTDGADGKPLEFVGTLVLPPGKELEGDGVIVGYSSGYIELMASKGGPDDFGTDFLPILINRTQAERLGDA